MKETVEHNNRFYGEELKTESEQLKEWLVVANKHNEELQKERDMYKGSFEEMSKNYFESQNEIERLNNIIKEAREYIKQTGQYLEDIKRFKVDVLEPDYLNLLEILKGSDKEWLKN